MRTHGRSIGDEIEPKQECLEAGLRAVNARDGWREVHVAAQDAYMQRDQFIVYDASGLEVACHDEGGEGIASTWDVNMLG
jgi:hypothetical protein